jgi:DNA-binding LacI/PurR family transcriptional regulator
MEKPTIEALARDTEIVEIVAKAFGLLSESVLLLIQAFEELGIAVPPDLDLTAFDDEEA